MGFLIFFLVVILVFTALSLERILKDIRDQNKEIIELLKKGDLDKEDFETKD
ncbi:MAG: hypothetical protein RR642_12665 [Solibacillus sp.]